MELLLIATYTALCWAIFKIFKIPVNKWSIPSAILGGVVGEGEDKGGNDDFGGVVHGTW